MTSASSKSIVVRQPDPGRWRVVVDPARVPRGRSAFTLTEVVANPRLGTVTIDGAALPRERGASWSARATVTPSELARGEGALAAVFEGTDAAAEAAERVRGDREWKTVPSRPIALGTAIVPLRR